MFAPRRRIAFADREADPVGLFFVLRLGSGKARPQDAAEFEVQILDSKGRAASWVYLDESGQPLVSEENESASRPDIDSVPEAVLRAALQQKSGKGEYVDERGRPVPPF